MFRLYFHKIKSYLGRIVQWLQNIVKLKYYGFNNFLIEISGCCNSKCKYCCTGSGNHITETKFMKAETFENVIKHLIRIRVMPRSFSYIDCFSWGEPFLNPELNEILAIAGKYNKKINISSNFIKFPSQISKENYSNIGHVIFSLCSLDEEKYRYMYNADLKKTLDNFDNFLELRSKYNPSIGIVVYFIQYKFSQNEQPKVIEYFEKQRNITVNKNYMAGISDGYASMKFIETGIIEGYDFHKITKDIDLERMQYLFKYYAKKGVKCPLKSQLTINESSQLCLCVVVTSKNKEYNLGNILEMSKSEILEANNTQKLCNYCEELKIPWWVKNGCKYIIDESELPEKS